jgi:hypothetical protein
MTEVLRALALAGGAALVLLMLADAIGTLIITRARTARWRPTRLWYSTTWRCTRTAAARVVGAEVREPYGNRLQQLIDYTLAPHGFWGHSAEATVIEEVARATAEARFRARRRANRVSLPG